MCLRIKYLLSQSIWKILNCIKYNENSKIGLLVYSRLFGTLPVKYNAFILVPRRIFSTFRITNVGAEFHKVQNYRKQLRGIYPTRNLRKRSPYNFSWCRVNKINRRPSIKLSMLTSQLSIQRANLCAIQNRRLFFTFC